MTEALCYKSVLDQAALGIHIYFLQLHNTYWIEKG